MVLRTNTLEYAFATSTSALAAATRLDLTAITVDVAENSSRTFRSVYVEVYDRGNELLATSMTSWLIGIKIDDVAVSDVTVTSTINNTGDQQSHAFRSSNIASYFQTNYTGTSHSVRASVQFGGLPTINIAAKLVITYEFDDTSQTTRTKTVRIPIESGTSTLTATLAEIGTNQVPQLTGSGSPLLPESSINIKDLFFDIMGNEGHASGIVSDQLGVALDSESEVQFGALSQLLDSSPFMRVLWKRTDMDPTVAHAFKARGTVTGRFAQLCAILTVTYTYDHSSSSTILNSIMLPLPHELGALGGTTSGSQSKVSAKFHVQEPATVTLKQSAVWLGFNAALVTITGLNVAVGGQTSRAYTPQTANNSPAGQHTLLHRFDSGGAAGSGLSLARGENELSVAYYRTSSASGAVGAGAQMVAYLNYTSGKASAGANAHNHTTLWLVEATAAVGTTTIHDYPAFAPNVPESAYWVTGMGYSLELLHVGQQQVTLAAERLSGEGVADGWLSLDAYAKRGGNEVEVDTLWIDATPHYRRHPSDPDASRMDVEGSRQHRVMTYFDPTTTHGGWTSLAMVVTYHAIAVSCSRAISGYSGDGSGIAVNIYRDDTKERLCTATSASGGGYTFTAYDDSPTTGYLFAEARQDATRVARSDRFLPS